MSYTVWLITFRALAIVQWLTYGLWAQLARKIKCKAALAIVQWLTYRSCVQQAGKTKCKAALIIKSMIKGV